MMTSYNGAPLHKYWQKSNTDRTVSHRVEKICTYKTIKQKIVTQNTQKEEICTYTQRLKSTAER